MSSVGRARVEVAKDDSPLDLTALPDPRPIVTVTIAATRRLLDECETASRRFHTAAPTVAEEVAEFEALVASNQLDRRSLASRTGAVVDVLDRLTQAIAEAEIQADQNLVVLALYERAVNQMETSTVPNAVRQAMGFRDRTGDLIVANGDLNAAMSRARALLPACVAATNRIAHAAMIVSRRCFVADVTRQLGHARMILNTALAQRQAQTAQEAGLLAMIDRLVQRTGQAMPLPDVIWPNNNKDPFAGPTLKEP